MTREEAILQCDDLEYQPTAFQNWYNNLIDSIYDNFEQQIANLNSNLEAQEIMIADYKKRIAEYEEWYIHRNEAQRLQDKNTGYMLQHIEELQSKVAELEQPKDCKLCKHSVESDDGYDFFCPIQNDYFNEGMCCNKYESKDSK